MRKDRTPAISLYRRRPRLPWILAASAIPVVAAGVVTAQLIGHAAAFTPTGVPRVQGDVAITPIVEAQDAFHAETGRYATDLIELEHGVAGDLRPIEFLRYRVTGAEDGSAYIAGAVGSTGGYFAVVHDDEEVVGTGQGDTFAAALVDAGWSPRWASQHGFLTTAEVESPYGAIAVRDADTVAVRMDEGGVGYTATVTPHPVSAVGVDLTAAAAAADIDLTAYPPVPATGGSVTGADGSTLTVAAEDAVSVRVDYPATATASALEADEALEAAGVAETVIPNPASRFTCATAFSPDRIHSATLCQAVTGEMWAFASTGAGAAAQTPEIAFGSVGATTRWAAEREVVLPGWDDLF